MITMTLPRSKIPDIDDHNDIDGQDDDHKDIDGQDDDHDDADLAQVWNAKGFDCAVVVSSHLSPVAPSNL